jgi:hypothetical protein
MMPWCNQDATFLHLGCDPKVKEGTLENNLAWAGRR